ncbi:glycosyltransferase 61 family protein [Azospirillum sp. A1-3]|uniref:glycosyltransferase 61 family protein n=1 Tax=Azospirillum sp. A1-3 TaxID=185874 RepID=UPI0020776670|nr:glycosyltransferase 61 family protein [Azospirillum sp. A1-3]MCM8738511.1 glycosyltransferase 61 family protein [Azospirillum sp. A1-3]
MPPIPSSTSLSLAEALGRALSLYENGRFAESGELCRAILRSLPDQAETACLLGTVEAAQGRTAEGVRLFKTAIALKPGFQDAHRNAALLEETRPEHAVRLYRRSLVLDPSDGAACHALVLLQGRMGNEEAALTLLRQGIGRAPGHVPLRELHAATHERAAVRALERDDPDGMAAACAEALRGLADAPPSAALYEGLERLVRLALLAGRPDLAVALLAIKDRYDFPALPASAIDRFPLRLLGFADWCAAAGLRHALWTPPVQPLSAALSLAQPDWLRGHVEGLARLGDEPVGVALDAEVEVAQGFYVKDNYESFVLAGRRAMLCETTATVVKNGCVPLVGVTPGATAAVFRLPRPLYRTVEIDQPVLFLPSTPNYWHFLVDVLPRLMVCDRVPETRDLPLLLFDLRGYQREMLELVGIAPDRILDARALVGPGVTQVHYRLARAAVPSAVSYPAAYRWLRDRFLPLRRPRPPSQGGRLYLSRRGSAPKHRIANDEAVAARLAGHGFETVQPERLGVLETVERIADAEIVVAPVGAATANQVFLPPGGTWIHLHNPDFFHPHSPWNPQMGTQIPMLGGFRHLAGCFTDEPDSRPADLLARLDIPVDIDLDALGRLVGEGAVTQQP